jgi:hypothetical protein
MRLTSDRMPFLSRWSCVALRFPRNDMITKVNTGLGMPLSAQRPV